MIMSWYYGRDGREAQESPYPSTHHTAAYHTTQGVGSASPIGLFEGIVEGGAHHHVDARDAVVVGVGSDSVLVVFVLESHRYMETHLPVCAEPAHLRREHVICTRPRYVFLTFKKRNYAWAWRVVR